jgi:hypothetical protein
MDYYEYSKILEEPCCFNYENYISDTLWANQSSLSQSTKKEAIRGYLDKEEEIKKNKFDHNTMKFYE